jgi:hypothetical protein
MDQNLAEMSDDANLGLWAFLFVSLYSCLWLAYIPIWRHAAGLGYWWCVLKHTIQLAAIISQKAGSNDKDDIGLS